LFTSFSPNLKLFTPAKVPKVELIEPKKDLRTASNKKEQEMMAQIAQLNNLSIRYQKFNTLLMEPNINIEQLRKLSWPGIPSELRPTVWKLFLGYLPRNQSRRQQTLDRKRKEYQEFMQNTFEKGHQLDQTLVRQVVIINIDLY
jgi:hypothetical protein